MQLLRKIMAVLYVGSDLSVRLFFVAQDRQADTCLHVNPFAGRKNMEHEVRNVRVRNRVGVILLLFTPCGVSSNEDLPMKVAFGKGANSLSTVLHVLTLSAASAQSCLNSNVSLHDLTWFMYLYVP